MSELEIQIYKVDDFDHHVPESIDKAFKDVIKQAGKQYQCDDSYPNSLDRHQENCDNSVEANKIFHPQDGVLTETIQDVNVQIYEVNNEGENFIIHCPLELIDALEGQISFNKQQSSEGDEYSITIREYRDKCKYPSSNECFISIDTNFKNYDPLASLFAKELTKRNINKEDSTMTTKTKADQTETIEKSLSELSKIEARIDQAIDEINNQFKTLVEQELRKVSEEATSLKDLGNDLKEADLDTILVVNAQWTSNMTFEDKQKGVVEIIKQLGENSLEYKMAVACRLQHTKTNIAKSLKSKLAKKTNATVKNELKSADEAFNNCHKEVFQQESFVSDEALNKIGEANATRLFNNLRAKRQKQRDRAFEVLTPATVSAVMDDCYQEFEREVKLHMATVSSLASKLKEEQLNENKNPVCVEANYDQLVRDAKKAVKDNMPKVEPRKVENNISDKEEEKVEQPTKS